MVTAGTTNFHGHNMDYNTPSWSRDKLNQTVQVEISAHTYTLGWWHHVCTLGWWHAAMDRNPSLD